MLNWLFHQTKNIPKKDLEGIIKKYLMYSYSLTPILLQKMNQLEEADPKEIISIFESDPELWLKQKEQKLQQDKPEIELNENPIQVALKDYIDEIKKHKNAKGSIKFNHGFFFGTGWWQAKNRERNYNLAKKLYEDLKTHPVATIFKPQYIQHLRQSRPGLYGLHHYPGTRSRVDELIEKAVSLPSI
jgi:hypothetical protein